MTLSPKAKANVFSIAVYAPYLLASILYREQLSQRAWTYLGLLFVLPAMLANQWVYHREAMRLPTPARPKAELNITPDRLPQVVWLAILPPLIATTSLWWVTRYGSELPWRDTWLGPPKAAASHKMFLMLGIMFVIWNCLGSWRAVLGLAQWHGMPRAYISRRRRLLLAVTLQWLMLVGVTAWGCIMLFRLPPVLAIALGLLQGVTMSAMAWVYWQEQQLRKGEPPIGTWCYFDFRDPAFLGPSGLNLASAWSWVLAVVALSPIVLAEWLLHQGTG